MSNVTDFSGSCLAIYIKVETHISSLFKQSSLEAENENKTKSIVNSRIQIIMFRPITKQKPNNR
jgi:hypothetical protein